MEVTSASVVDQQSKRHLLAEPNRAVRQPAVVQLKGAGRHRDIGDD
jgi:hypothetical protein